MASNAKAIKELLEDVKRNYQGTEEAMQDCIIEAAKIYRMKYEALIKAGFNETQAMELVKLWS